MKNSSTASQASVKHSTQQSNPKAEGQTRTQSSKDQDKAQDHIKTTRQHMQQIALSRAARPQRKLHPNALSGTSSNKSFKTGLQR